MTRITRRPWRSWAAALPLVATMLGGCGSPDVRPVPERRLEPSWVFGQALADTTLAWPGSFDVVACTLVVSTGFSQNITVLASDGRLLRRIAREGEGPGELKGFGRISVGPDGTIHLVGGGRHRYIRYRMDGTLVSDARLHGGFMEHILTGPIAALPDGRLADYWMGGQIGNRSLFPVLDSAPLVALLGPSGAPQPGGWGRPTRPPEPDDYMLSKDLQTGDLALWRDSLYVLRTPTAVVEVYAAGTYAPEPVRSIRLQPYRPVPDFREEGARLIRDAMGRSFVKGSANMTYQFDFIAEQIAVDGAGRIYVVMRDGTPAGEGVPGEVLAVYSPRGEVLAEGRLPGQLTQDLKVARDGTILVLSLPSHDRRDDERVLQVFPALFPADGPGCPWPG